MRLDDEALSKLHDIHNNLILGCTELANSQVLGIIGKAQPDIPTIITEYAAKGIYIDIMADGYNLQDDEVSWRGAVTHKGRTECFRIDCGCAPNWLDAAIMCLDCIERYQLAK